MSEITVKTLIKNKKGFLLLRPVGRLCRGASNPLLIATYFHNRRMGMVPCDAWWYALDYLKYPYIEERDFDA